MHPDPALAAQQLTAAGYQRDAQGHWTLLGAPLHVTVGAPTDRPRFLAIAQEAAKELTAAGVAVDVVTAPGTSLFTDPTVVPTPPSVSASPSPSASASAAADPAAPSVAPGPPGPAHPGHGSHGGPAHPVATPSAPPPATPTAGQVAAGPVAASSTASSSATPTTAAPPAAPAGVVVDLTVMPRAVGADLPSTAASNYGCPPGMAGVAAPARNSTGFCLAALQPVLDATLGGALAPDQAAATIEATLWQQLPAIPLFQAVTTLVTTPKGDQLTGHVGPGPLTIGPFGTAPSWQPANQ
jgi:ABC-type transport system substrate-binding protein